MEKKKEWLGKLKKLLEKGDAEGVRIVARGKDVITPHTQVFVRNGRKLGDKMFPRVKLETMVSLEETVDGDAIGLDTSIRLHRAVVYEGLRGVRRLIEQREKVNVCDGQGRTALFWAVKEDDLDMVRYLVKRGGANLDICTGVFTTVLHVAVDQGSLDMVGMLLEFGASVNVCNRRGDSPIAIAVRKGFLGIVEMLLTAGAEVNVVTRYDNSLLGVAVARNDLAMTELMIRHGVRVDAKPKNGERALEIAVWRGNPEIVEVLCKAGARFDPLVDEDRALIAVAAGYDNAIMMRMIELLLEEERESCKST